jgi:serine/threonine protein phosphatase 1
MFWKPNNKNEISKTAEAYVAENHLVWAIGDIHGRAELVYPILNYIWLDILKSGQDFSPFVVFVGDYIDRGLSSRTVIDAVMRFGSVAPAESVYLLGNHEQMFLSFYDGEPASARWLDYGGRQTAASYDVQVPARALSVEEIEAVRLELREKVPEAHVDFFRSLKLFFETGDYVLVHAGMKPGVPLEEQSGEDLLWRRGSEKDDKKLSRTVVHGHTPHLTPRLSERRIGIDTGAYQTSILTAVRLQGCDRKFISTQMRNGKITVVPSEL